MLIGDHSKYKPYIVNICGLLSLAGKEEALDYMGGLPLKSMKIWWHVVRLGILRWVKSKNGC